MLKRYKIAKRLAGAAFAIGVIIGSVRTGFSSIADPLAIGFAFMVGAYLLTQLALIVLDSSLEYSSKNTNPFTQGVAFVSFAMVSLLLFDFLLLKGTFLFYPIVSLIIDGNLSETYWGCEGTWISDSDGQSCSEW